jgi:hypothetical protein
MENEVIREETVRPVRFPQMIHRISWGAIWSGVLIALGMGWLLTMFGLWIGFRMYNVQSEHPWGGINNWSTIWYFVTWAWSMFFGAWCAARFAGYPGRETGILHGITVWALGSVVVMMTLTTGTWAVLREGINALSNLTVTVPNGAPPAGQIAQATTSAISSFALRTCIGVVIGFLAAILGGLIGRVSTATVTTRETPLAPRVAA